MDTIINQYYEDNAKKLRVMVDKILFKLGFGSLCCTDDFYCLANEVFTDVVRRYDGSQDFNGFLYSCLTNKFKTEMTRRNRQKRQADRDSISLDTPIDDESGFVLSDMIPDKNADVEKSLLGETEEGYSDKMLSYLKKLSVLQREVLRLMSIGFLPNEIKEELHITDKQYLDCNEAIHSYRNVAVLF